MEREARFTVKMELTDYGRQTAMSENLISAFGKWIIEFEKSKDYYVEQGYTIVSEDLEKGEFVVEK